MGPRRQGEVHGRREGSALRRGEKADMPGPFPGGLPPRHPPALPPHAGTVLPDQTLCNCSLRTPTTGLCLPRSCRLPKPSHTSLGALLNVTPPQGETSLASGQMCPVPPQMSLPRSTRPLPADSPVPALPPGSRGSQGGAVCVHLGPECPELGSHPAGTWKGSEFCEPAHTHPGRNCREVRGGTASRSWVPGGGQRQAEASLLPKQRQRACDTSLFHKVVFIWAPKPFVEQEGTALG